MTFVPHPNSLAALERYQGGLASLPKCGRPGCGQPRVKDQIMCRKHGGKVPDKKLTPQRLAARMAHRILRQAYDQGMISTELQGQPVWIACGHWRRVHLRPVLLAAWLSQEGEAWPRVVSQVEQVFANEG